MNIVILIQDKVKSPRILEGIEYYQKMCSGWSSVSIEQVPDRWKPGRKTGKSSGDILSSFLKTTDYLVALDRKGTHRPAWSPDSIEFSEFVAEIMQGAWHRLVFAVGGADGLPAPTLEQAHRVLSLSRLTFPHDLVPLILVEQIYRALTILHRHPYHR
jgi:23S rRNA (pseudouridine1915-N3)-methyltransferase